MNTAAPLVWVPNVDIVAHGRFGAWREFWGKAVREASHLWSSFLAAILSFGSALALLGIALVVWRPQEPDRPLAVPLLIIMMILLLGLCQGAYLTWRKEVEGPRSERDRALQLVAWQEAQLDTLYANAREWQLLADLLVLADDRRVPDELAKVGPLPDDMKAHHRLHRQFDARHALRRWINDVQQVLFHHGRQAEAAQFYAVSQPDMPGDTAPIYEAHLQLLKTWSRQGSELFPDLGRPERGRWVG